jgi:hypothetical protein
MSCVHNHVEPTRWLSNPRVAGSSPAAPTTPQYSPVFSALPLHSSAYTIFSTSLPRLPKIRTEFVHPPIPLRQFDWLAVDDNTYDGPGSPIGWGSTEQAAIVILLEQLEKKGKAA